MGGKLRLTQGVEQYRAYKVIKKGLWVGDLFEQMIGDKIWWCSYIYVNPITRERKKIKTPALPSKEQALSVLQEQMEANDNFTKHLYEFQDVAKRLGIVTLEDLIQEAKMPYGED